MTTPVLLIAFNRPETTRAVFAKIRQARPPRLYLASDGARQGRPGETEIGDTALLLQDSPAVKVYAFEPVPGIFEALVEVCAPFRKIQPVQLGLGKVDQEATFVVNDSGSRLAEIQCAIAAKRDGEPLAEVR